MKLGANEQRTKLDISQSIPVNRNGIGSTVRTKSIRNSNSNLNNNHSNSVAIDEFDPVVLAKCQMQCLSLFLFYFDIHGNRMNPIPMTAKTDDYSTVLCYAIFIKYLKKQLIDLFSSFWNWSY